MQSLVLACRFGCRHVVHVIRDAHRPFRHFRLRSALDVVAQGDDFAVVGQRAAVFFDLAVPGADLLARVEQEGFTLYGDVVPVYVDLAQVVPFGIEIPEIHDSRIPRSRRL